MSAPESGGWLRAHVRPLLVALAAGGSYGGWAAFAHHRLGAAVALRAGLMQSVLSVTATLMLVLVLERLFRWQSNPVRGFWFASLGTSTVAAVWLIAGHMVAGTPHIAVAIAPSLIVGTAFYFVYARTLLRQARQVQMSPERFAHGGSLAGGHAAHRGDDRTPHGHRRRIQLQLRPLEARPREPGRCQGLSVV